MRIAIAGLLLLALGGASPARAAPGDQGGPVLVELFTSQGCSSCPPAERLLGQLPARGFGRDKVIPLTFHVDYWDHLGWPDPFARPQWTARQSWYARSGRLRPAGGGAEISGLYTPQMVVNGQTHLAGGQAEAALRAIAAAGSRMRRVPLTLRARASGDEVRATVDLAAGGPAGAGDWRVTVALVQKSAQTRVLHGENAGETLQETALVRELSPALPATGPRLEATFRRPRDLAWTNAALVAFVQSAATGEVAGVADLEVLGP
ncbi:MAG TPA: DUF1223 domain-containing protein [Polyangia bacterium]|nr:DUF1223 domain-containing protein [Polyangia bacterium]